MKVEHCRNLDCLRIFEYREIGKGMPLTKRQEFYHCPFCNHRHELLTAGVIIVNRFSEETERVIRLMMGETSV